MNEILLWRKIARIVTLLSQRLGVDAKQALNIFYSSRVCELIHNPKSGLQLLSDAYVAEEIVMELQHS